MIRASHTFNRESCNISVYSNYHESLSDWHYSLLVVFLLGCHLIFVVVNTYLFFNESRSVINNVSNEMYNDTEVLLNVIDVEFQSFNLSAYVDEDAVNKVLDSIEDYAAKYAVKNNLTAEENQMLQDIGMVVYDYLQLNELDVSSETSQFNFNELFSTYSGQKRDIYEMYLHHRKDLKEGYGFKLKSYKAEETIEYSPDTNQRYNDDNITNTIGSDYDNDHDIEFDQKEELSDEAINDSHESNNGDIKENRLVILDASLLLNAEQGRINGIDVSIGDHIEDVISKLGEPVVYYKDPQFGVESLEYDGHTISGTEVYLIKVDSAIIHPLLGLEEVKRIFGEPTGGGRSRDYSHMYYEVGEYALDLTFNKEGTRIEEIELGGG